MFQTSRLARAIRLLIIVLVSTAPLIPLQPAEAAADVAWNVACPISHFGRDDPIVKPNMFGASHMHAFYGNTSTNAATTTASLLAAPSTCERGFSGTDHSGYWIPALYRKLPDGSLQQISGTNKDLRMTVYYRGDGSTGQKVAPFPHGLRMVAGNADATSPQPLNVTGWRCRSLKGDMKTQLQSSIPTCSSSEFVQGVVHFPNCWDGKNLDSADHKTHMTYMKGKACPADHPVRVPAVTFDIANRSVNGNGSQFELSSGGQFSLHGDFFAAWDNQAQSALVNSCLNAGKKCTGIQRSQINMAAATPGSGSQVLADTTTAATPAAAPTGAQSLPSTGPIATASAIVGLSAIAYSFYVFRLRRRSLRLALLRPRTPR